MEEGSRGGEGGRGVEGERGEGSRGGEGEGSRGGEGGGRNRRSLTMSFRF